MKLLIDIPEHIYEHAKETSEDSRDEFDAMRAIANGTQQESRSEIPNTCGDAISRKYILDLIATKGANLDDDLLIVEQWIQDAPSVNPQQRTGRWIFDEILDKHYYCSECKSMGVDYWDYCPNCGAKMEVEENG